MDYTRHLGSFLALACGDALGASVEFQQRHRLVPVTGMRGGGKFRLKPGEWTDDTSIALCLASSLIESHGFDPHDQMRRYCRWAFEGEFSCKEKAFGLGKTVLEALGLHRKTGEAYCGSEDPRKAGNGSLMRLAPVPIYFYPDRQKAIFYAGESSRVTHASPECILCCQVFAEMLCRAFDGQSKEEILQFKDPGDLPGISDLMRSVLAGEYRHKQSDAIRSSGYVVESLEAALWAFASTDTLEDAILTAVNLGDDADTVGAICGQLAGAYYGAEAIPTEWLDVLAMRSTIEEMCRRLIGARG